MQMMTFWFHDSLQFVQSYYPSGTVLGYHGGDEVWVRLLSLNILKSRSVYGAFWRCLGTAEKKKVSVFHMSILNIMKTLTLNDAFWRYLRTLIDDLLLIFVFLRGGGGRVPHIHLERLVSMYTIGPIVSRLKDNTYTCKDHISKDSMVWMYMWIFTMYSYMFCHKHGPYQAA